MSSFDFPGDFVQQQCWCGTLMTIFNNAGQIQNESENIRFRDS
jgi:hypothetical protein